MQQQGKSFKELDRLIKKHQDFLKKNKLKEYLVFIEGRGLHIFLAKNIYECRRKITKAYGITKFKPIESLIKEKRYARSRSK